MYCFMVSALLPSPFVKLSKSFSTFADVKSRISTILSNAMGGSKNDTAVGLIVVKTVAPGRIFPDKRVSMGWWHLRLSAKILALLRLSANFFQLRLTKKLKINFFCFKKLNIN